MRRVIAADTTVVLDGLVSASRPTPPMRGADGGALAGRTHEVCTGIAVAARAAGGQRGGTRGRDDARAARDDEIAAYVATGEPMDKAGAYGIQGFGATIVSASRATTSP
jgi:septum formation protein